MAEILDIKLYNTNRKENNVTKNVYDKKDMIYIIILISFIALCIYYFYNIIKF